MSVGAIDPDRLFIRKAQFLTLVKKLFQEKHAGLKMTPQCLLHLQRGVEDHMIVWFAKMNKIVKRGGRVTLQQADLDLAKELSLM